MVTLEKANADTSADFLEQSDAQEEETTVHSTDKQKPTPAQAFARASYEQCLDHAGGTSHRPASRLDDGLGEKRRENSTLGGIGA